MSESHNPQDAAHSLPHRLQAYEKQRGARREEQKELQRAAAQDQVRGFLEKEAAIVSRPLNPFTTKASSGPGPDDARPGPSAGPTGKDEDKALPSFWIPSLTPEAKATKLEKPVSPRSMHPCTHFATGPGAPPPPGPSPGC